MKTVKCVICGAEFITDKGNKKYCSLICKDAGIALKRMKWKEANPEYYKNVYQKNKEAQRAYYKKYYQDHKDRYHELYKRRKARG